jgi:MFS transporter, MHS family, alpha-ketoglutarate permease
MSATETGADAQIPAAVMAPGLSPMQRLRAILGGSAGNLVEWYDWFAYSAFSIYFASIFFPAGDSTAQLMKTAVVFAVGFGARPVGAWLMGMYADRAGPPPSWSSPACCRVCRWAASTAPAPPI